MNALQKISYIGFLIGLSTFVLIWAKSIIIPIVFSILLALSLIPLCNFWERLGINRLWSTILSLFALLVVGSILVTIFSWLFVNIFQDMPSIRNRLLEGISRIQEMVANSGRSIDTIENRIQENAPSILNPIFRFLENSLSSSLLLIGNVFLVLLYTFFMLLYRTTFKAFLIQQTPRAYQEQMNNVCNDIQAVVQNYLFGMLVVIMILGIVNSLGLWLIGIDHAPFWGFLAACLVIIPYLGTTLGGTLPFLYALATTGTIWQPAAVVLFYFTIQQIEGNFITPNIIGSRIQINAFIAILGMLVGAFIWGIAGIILALPLTGILKIILDQFPTTKSIGLLMGDNIQANAALFKSEMNHSTYRFIFFLRRRD